MYVSAYHCIRVYVSQVIKTACIDEELQGGSYLSNCLVKLSEGTNGYFFV
jgi:hypothetical protein